MLSVIIPVYNEEEILRDNALRLSSYLATHLPGSEILLLDNGSTDRTAEIGAELARAYPEIRYFRLSERGPGRAFATGVLEARHQIIITQDADLSADLSFIINACALLGHVDAVVGAKSFGKQRRTLIRVLGSQIFILFSQLLFDLPFADFSMGAKAFKRTNLLPLLESLDPWTGYTLEILVDHSERDLRVVQIGVDCEDTRRSSFNLLHEALYRFKHLWQVKKIKNKNNER